MELNGKEYKLVPSVGREDIDDNDIYDVCEECALKEYCDNISDEINDIDYMLCEGDEFYNEDEFQYYKEINKDVKSVNNAEKIINE